MPTITVDRPCKRCGSYERVKNGGKCRPCWNKYQRERKAGIKRGEVQVSAYDWHDDGKRRCKGCSILLEHPATMDYGELCGVCAGKVPAQRAVVYGYG